MVEYHMTKKNRRVVKDQVVFLRIDVLSSQYRELLPDIDDFLGPMNNKIVIMFVVAQEVVISPSFPAFDPPRTAVCSYILYMYPGIIGRASSLASAFSNTLLCNR
jgi:hypothetical protein